MLWFLFGKFFYLSYCGKPSHAADLRDSEPKERTLVFLCKFFDPGPDAKFDKPYYIDASQE